MNNFTFSAATGQPHIVAFASGDVTGDRLIDQSISLAQKRRIVHSSKI